MAYNQEAFLDLGPKEEAERLQSSPGCGGKGILEALREMQRALLLCAVLTSCFFSLLPKSTDIALAVWISINPWYILLLALSPCNVQVRFDCFFFFICLFSKKKKTEKAQIS